MQEETIPLIVKEHDHVHPLPWFGSPVQPRHRCSVDSTCRHALPDKDRGGGQAVVVILGIILGIMTLLLTIVAISPEKLMKDFVHDNALCDGSTIQETGYLNVSNHQIFTWFFHARKDSEHAPLLFWIGSGPEIQSSIAQVITGNGPCRLLTNSSTTTTFNTESLTQIANVVYLDYPSSVGFSYPTTQTEKLTLQHVIDHWLTLHPAFQSHPLYLMGQGTALPVLVQTAAALKDRLNGIVIGNGIHPLAEVFIALPSVISMTETLRIQSQHCASWLKANRTDVDKMKDCETKVISPLVANTTQDPFNALQNGSSVELSQLTTFFNSDRTKSALRIAKDHSWKASSLNPLLYRIEYDQIETIEPMIEVLKSRIKVLIYVGQNDLIGSWVANENWLNQIHPTLSTATWTDFGTYRMKQTERLRFVVIPQAGNAPGRTHPIETLKILKDFI